MSFVGVQRFAKVYPRHHRLWRKRKPFGLSFKPVPDLGNDLTWASVVLFTTPADLMARLSNPPETLEHLSE